MRDLVDRPRIRRGIAFFMPLAVLATLSIFATYSADQQVIRQSANDPQRAIAVAAAARLNAGASPASVVESPAVDMAVSLLPWTVVLDTNGRVVASGATLSGVPADPPPGFGDEARAHGIDQVTWQPAANVRSATVTIPWKGGAVVSGRSLGPSEERSDALLWDLVAGGGISLVLLAAAVGIAVRIWPD